MNGNGIRDTGVELGTVDVAVGAETRIEAIVTPELCTITVSGLSSLAPRVQFARIVVASTVETVSPVGAAI